MVNMGKEQQVDTGASLEQWLNGRSDWLRRAAAELIAGTRRPTDDEIKALADHCHREAADELTSPHPLIAEGAIAMAPTGGELRIQKVCNISGVNALGPTAALQLDQGAITVIYGSNGSGKTGYSRLLKEMCGCRVRDKTIYPNVFVAKTALPSASVTLTVGGTVEQPIDWKSSDGSVSKLGAVQIFDAQSATQFCDSTSPATHEPRTMRFVAVLIITADRVADALRKRREAMVSTLPELAATFQATVAGKFYQDIKASTKPEDIAAACQTTTDEAQERIALETVLAQVDPVARLTAVGVELKRIEKLRDEMATLQADLSDERIKTTFDLRDTAAEKRKAAQEYAEKFFAEVPLPGVGEATWRELWRHAKDYSETVAYPGHEHPNFAEGARCVLCQQVLSGEAKARLQSFSAYLTNALETEAVAAENAVVLGEKNIPVPPPAAQWNLIGAATGVTVEVLTKLENAVKARIGALTIKASQADVPSVDWSEMNAAVVAAIQSLTAEQTSLQAVADPEGYAKQSARLLELQACEWIATVRDSMIEEAQRQQRVKALEKAISFTNTTTLTQKSNEIGAAELAGGYKERFNKELRDLRGNQLPVRLEHKKEGKGKFTFFIELRDAQGNVASRAVLSEGEQRVVALASFLADVTANDRSTPLIFDDPISSLDQVFEEAVAKRLVALAKTRQVIVFTHRLSLMALVDDAQEKLKEAGAPIKFHVEVIQREDDATGVPSTLDVFSETPMKGLNKLIAAVSSLKQMDSAIQKLATKGICSNFRIILERVVENHLCAGVVIRFRRDVQTRNRIFRLAAIEPQDCQLVDEKMTKYSAFEHSQANETPGPLPNHAELLADVEAVKTWLAEFLDRMKKDFP
jgi:energy-coupling factor transporter ATP-binding protein EcfA2